MIYANSAGTSWPKPAPVTSAVADALDAPPSAYPEILAGAHAAIADAFGIDSPERLVITPGCTGALAAGISNLPWIEGDRVLTSSLEHAGIAHPVAKLSSERGVEHEAIAYHPADGIDLDALEDSLRSRPARLVAVSYATNTTGHVLPVKDIVRLAQENGALCLIDAAQAAGVVQHSVGDLGCDLWAFAGHKGPQGPQGVGGLWAAPHVEFAVDAASCTLDGTAPSSMPGYCELGGANIAGAAGVAAGLRWLAETGLGKRGVELGRRFREGAAAIEGIEVLGGEARENGLATALIPHGTPIDACEQHLAAAGVLVRAGHHCAEAATRTLGTTDGCVRVSFGPTSTEDDVDRTLDAVRQLA